MWSFYAYVFFYIRDGEPRWLSGRASDSGARGSRFEPDDCRVVSLNKTLKWLRPNMTEKLLTGMLSKLKQTKPNIRDARWPVFTVNFIVIVTCPRGRVVKVAEFQRS